MPAVTALPFLCVFLFSFFPFSRHIYCIACQKYPTPSFCGKAVIFYGFGSISRVYCLGCCVHSLVFTSSPSNICSFETCSAPTTMQLHSGVEKGMIKAASILQTLWQCAGECVYKTTPVCFSCHN